MVKNWQLRLIQLLAIPGLLLSYYLWLFHNGDVIAVCGSSGWDDCGAVSGPNALYSAIGPLSVAAIGMVGYLVIFLLVWLYAWLPPLQTYMPELMVGVTALAFLFSLGLTGLELFVIHAFCRYCVVSAILVTLMFVSAVSYLRVANIETDE